MKKINFWDPVFGKKELKNINNTFKTNYLNDGYVTRLLEEKIQKILKVKHAVCVTSGTASIFLALKSLGVNKNDEVIMPDLAYGATANAILLTGAKLVLCDVDKSLCFDIEKLKNKITAKTKVIIPIHISGRSGNFHKIIEIAKKKKIFLVEDAAEALFSKYKNSFLGTAGEIGCFSLTASKIITSGQGGIVVTNKTNLYKKILLLKNQGVKGASDGGNVVHKVSSFNFKYTNLQSAVALGQIESLKKRIFILKKNNFFYKKYLKNVKQIQLLDFDDKNIPLWNDCYVKNRNKLFLYLKRKNIYCRKFWHPIHTHKPFKKYFDKSLKNSKIFSKKLIWLPSSYKLNDRSIKFICDQIKSFYKING